MMDLHKLAEEFRGLPGRQVFQKVLVTLGENYDQLVIIGADSFGSIRGDDFQKRFPERSFELGIAEQNMINVAVGMALQGKLPFVLMYGFTIARALEQIRDGIAYPKVNVKIVSNATGLDMGEGGVTHQSTEDIAIMRTLPNVVIVQPCSGLEVALVARAVVNQVDGPVYFRHTRQTYAPEAEQAAEDYYRSGGEFKIGEIVQLKEGSDLTLVGSGLTVGTALQAAALLEKDGIKCRVLNVHTIKPLDKETLSKAATETQGIITIEDQNVIGGLGEEICGAVSEKGRGPVVRIGIPDVFCEIGPARELYMHYGLSASKVAERVHRLLKEL